MSYKKNQIIKKGVLIALFFVFISPVFGQDEQDKPKRDFWNNVQFGGGIGLGFGNGFFTATLAPAAIYNFNDSVGLGVGLNGSINNRKNFYKQTVLGGSIIGLFNPAEELQLSAEFEQLNVNRNFDENFTSNVDDNFWNSALFLGAGYRVGNFSFGIRYDVLYDRDKSIYPEAWVPFGRFWF